MHDSNRRQWFTLAGAGLSVTMIGTPALRAAEKEEKEGEMEVSVNAAVV
jgi:hypothetical protein